MLEPVTGIKPGNALKNIYFRAQPTAYRLRGDLTLNLTWDCLVEALRCAM